MNFWNTPGDAKANKERILASLQVTKAMPGIEDSYKSKNTCS